jgi:eukaryotic-like serine/threonine-protein kinase
MNRLNHIVREIHRRSIWQVLGIYLVGSWIGYQVVIALTSGLGLPDWVPPFAVVLFVIGLPIVLATAFVQEGPPARPAASSLPDLDYLASAGSDPGPPARPAAGAGARQVPLGRLLTWPRAIAGGVLAFSLLGASAGGYMGMRVAGFGPLATLISRGDIDARDRVLLADFGSPPGDTLLAAALTEALRIDLEQSPVLLLVPPPQVRELLARTGRSPEMRLDEQLAREVAVREGLKAIVAGEVTRTGGQSFLVTARVLRAADGTPLASFREQASDEDQVLEALNRLSRSLRSRVGESLRSVRASEPLEQVTTSSLEALQLYSQALRIIHGGTGERGRALRLLEEAIALDAEFAMAYRRLATEYYNDGVQRARSIELLARVHELSDRLPERERLLAAATYQHLVAGDLDRAIDAYEAMVERFPDDRAAINNLAILLGEVGRHDRAIELSRRVIELDSTNALGYTNLAQALAAARRSEEAEQALEDFRLRFPDSPEYWLHAGIIAAVRHDVATARERARAFQRVAQQPIMRIRAEEQLVFFEAAAGRPGASRRHLRQLLGMGGDLGGGGRAVETAAQLSIAASLAWGEPPAEALRELEAALAARPLDSLAVADRPLAALALAMAAAGRFPEARALSESFLRDIAGARLAPRDVAPALEGMILTLEGRTDDGVERLRGARAATHCTE